MNKATKNHTQKKKTEKSLNANDKSLAEFYIGLTLAMYFWMLVE